MCTSLRIARMKDQISLAIYQHKQLLEEPEKRRSDVYHFEQRASERWVAVQTELEAWKSEHLFLDRWKQGS